MTSIEALKIELVDADGALCGTLRVEYETSDEHCHTYYYCVTTDTGSQDTGHVSVAANSHVRAMRTLLRLLGEAATKAPAAPAVRHLMQFGEVVCHWAAEVLDELIAAYEEMAV